MPTGSALVTNTVPISSNITVSEGGVEIVDNRGTSMGATIQKGGMQIVTRGATAMKTKIHGSKQFILEDKSITNLEDVEKRSSAYDATVSGGNGAVGQQNLYDGGMAWNTKVMQGGEQNLYMGQREDGGIAEGTIISGDGRQHILAGGRASNTTLNDKSVQVAYPDGIVDGLTISGHASSWLHVGVEVTGEIKINDKGHLYLFAGDRTDHITRGRVSVEGRNDEVLFLVGERHNMEKLQIDMESLSGSGGTVVFSSIPYDPGNISLYVQKLSGSLNFHFNISSTGSHSDYLWIESGAGNHKISVTDSGVEITGPLLQKNGIIEINLITDRSGGANFTLTDRFGEKIESVDGGTFIYGLYKRERSAEFSGDSTTWYLGRATGKLKFSNVNFQRVNKKPKTPVILATSSPDISTVNQSHRNFSSSQRQDSNSQTTRRKNNEQTSKPRPPRHLRDAQRSPAPPTVPFLENLSADTSYPADGYHNSDEKEPSVISADGQFLIDQMIVRPGQQGSSSPQFSQKLPVADFLTTPSTDAVLSMSVTPALVFHNELQAVRAGRGVLDRGKKNTAFWVHAIKSKEHIIADHKDF
ncbi:pertactin-like passenger domain-containing protein, partial [Bartonella henselae]|uniref:pertactin-like passenger domain-containing protein n=1 Tax=Bartonella henselae TaxID=38323 RepID=UPI0009657131